MRISFRLFLRPASEPALESSRAPDPVGRAFGACGFLVGLTPRKSRGRGIYGRLSSPASPALRGPSSACGGDRSGTPGAGGRSAPVAPRWRLKLRPLWPKSALSGAWARARQRFPVERPERPQGPAAERMPVQRGRTLEGAPARVAQGRVPQPAQAEAVPAHRAVARKRDRAAPAEPLRRRLGRSRPEGGAGGVLRAGGMRGRPAVA